MTLQRLDAGDCRLAVHESGRGAPVVVLHGFTGCAESMSGIARELEDSYRVLAVDLVGHGSSDAPGAVAAYRMEACVAQLASLLDGLAIERAHWLGYSMGGRAALAFALHNFRARVRVIRP